MAAAETVNTMDEQEELPEGAPSEEWLEQAANGRDGFTCVRNGRHFVVTVTEMDI